MSQVTVTINGRQFRMACEDGQENHLQRLAADLDQRIERLRKSFGEIGDTRLTVMAALTVADELGETGAKLRQMEQELAACRTRASAPPSTPRRRKAAVAAALNSAAERIEGITRRLNQTVSEGGVAMGVSEGSARARSKTRSIGGSRLGTHYIPGAGLRGASETNSRGLIDLSGSCPWPGPWAWSHGAHLLS